MNEKLYQANVELVDENRVLKEEKKILQIRIAKAIEYLLDKYVRGLLDDNEVNNVIKILKGSDKE